MKVANSSGHSVNPGCWKKCADSFHNKEDTTTIEDAPEDNTEINFGFRCDAKSSRCWCPNDAGKSSKFAGDSKFINATGNGECVLCDSCNGSSSHYVHQECQN